MTEMLVIHGLLTVVVLAFGALIGYAVARVKHEEQAANTTHTVGVPHAYMIVSKRLDGTVTRWLVLTEAGRKAGMPIRQGGTDGTDGSDNEGGEGTR